MGKLPKTLRETIKAITKTHLIEKNGLAMGQCLTAVGWVGGTLPELYEDKGMVELSMADVAGGGFAVGAALSGRRPMYIIRYQGFNWFIAHLITNKTNQPTLLLDFIFIAHPITHTNNKTNQPAIMASMWEILSSML